MSETLFPDVFVVALKIALKYKKLFLEGGLN